MENIFTEKGEFTIDTQSIIDTCVNQFSDTERWIVELILNAYDANSKSIIVTGEEFENYYNIIVSDDGHGMDFIAAEKCITKFSTIKKTDNAIGEFGLGLISVGHDKSQQKMHIISNTMLERNEITIEGNIKNVPRISIKSEQYSYEKTGTRVCVEFSKPIKDFSLTRTLETLKDYSESILQFLPVEIIFQLPATESNKKPLFKFGYKKWADEGFQYPVKIDNHNFEIVFSTGKNLTGGTHAYKKKVLVTKDFTSLQLPSIPYLELRINSDTWSLPIGRDNIILDSRLEKTIARLKQIIIIKCYPLIFNSIVNISLYKDIIEPIIISFLSQDITGPWQDYPVFQIYSRKKPCISYNYLKKRVNNGGYIFFLKNEKDLTGIDFHKIFPIVDSTQRSEKINLIKDKFSTHIRYIKSDEKILVYPAEDLDPEREKFQRYLKFDFTTLIKDEERGQHKLDTQNSSSIPRVKNVDNKAAKDRNAILFDKLSSLKFETGYLFNKSDGRPNTDYKLYYNNLLTSFNLSHPAIKKLLKYKDSKLAGHVALRIALTEDSGILNDLKFNQLVVDAILAIDLLARFKNTESQEFNRVIKYYYNILNRE